MSHIKQVIKRTGEVVPFNRERIVNAIYLAHVHSEQEAEA